MKKDKNTCVECFIVIPRTNYSKVICDNCRDLKTNWDHFEIIKEESNNG